MDAKLLSYAVVGALVGSPYAWAYMRRQQGRPVNRLELRRAVRRTKLGIAAVSMMAAIVFMVIAAMTGQLPKHPPVSNMPSAAPIGGTGR